ncbi:nucleotide-binding domain-containing protein [Russula aff. rugulosa BPL654]|nr:nucleotide-binding domain-containing protein [Russula aff. rugulosa BPL654]
MPQSPTNVVILGAGVIGLTIAHVLTEGEGSSLFNVTIVARDMPEDLTSQGFASPWAGANWSPMQSDDRRMRWEKHTFDKLWDMIPTGGVNRVPYLIYSNYGAEDIEKATSWWRGIPRNFRVLPGEHPFPVGFTSGVEFESVIVNPEVYLPWLKSELESRGVRFSRRRVSSLDEACGLAGESGAVINATGLGARSLFGVEDTKVYPIRGQTIIVYSPNIKECISVVRGGTTKSEKSTYFIPRASTPGMVLIGGTFEPNNWDTSISIPTADGILARAKEVVPALNDPTTRIHAHNVGLRPAREGGPRVEAQFINVPSKNDLIPRPASDASADTKTHLVVHSYGFGPAGYQQSWGAAEEVARLLKENLSQ